MDQWQYLLLVVAGVLNLVSAATNLHTALLNHRLIQLEQSRSGDE
jgi:hypothetical protein